eukprot:gnl/MRDRNA2_/MRDRNA2_47661_c0_seq1.p1 gnl/MRDRNA2_/MRDRNA2_47661_c0~~gnl/MRDRNA2_/MRDRNA2_47661_c0_seq1.p1  ORF type:complete len:329 (-),score=75.81 gnl/MRDRNA2_/MRDRNA2_47661_c0_seq1:145-1050(-)
MSADVASSQLQSALVQIQALEKSVAWPDEKIAQHLRVVEGHLHTALPNVAQIGEQLQESETCCMRLCHLIASEFPGIATPTLSESRSSLQRLSVFVPLLLEQVCSLDQSQRQTLQELDRLREELRQAARKNDQQARNAQQQLREKDKQLNTEVEKMVAFRLEIQNFKAQEEKRLLAEVEGLRKEKQDLMYEGLDDWNSKGKLEKLLQRTVTELQRRVTECESYRFIIDGLQAKVRELGGVVSPIQSPSGQNIPKTFEEIAEAQGGHETNSSSGSLDYSCRGPSSTSAQPNTSSSEPNDYNL